MSHEGEIKAGPSNPLRSAQEDEAKSTANRRDGMEAPPVRDQSRLTTDREDEVALRSSLDAGTSSTELRRPRDARPWLLLLSVLVIVLDRLTKLLVESRIALGDAVNVVTGVFRVTHVRNTGAAFSIFAETASPALVRAGLIAFSLLAGSVVAGLLWRWGRRLSPASVGLALILGGAIGNLYDRVRLHYVTDFLEVHIVHYHWPDFNVADSAISVGAVLLLVDMLFAKSDESSAA